MSHVTFFWFKAAPGKRQAVIDTFNRWERERKPKVKGFERSILVSSLSDPDEFVAGVRFDSTDNYNANSNDPAQHAWYQELRANLVEDPGWFNGSLERETTA